VFIFFVIAIEIYLNSFYDDYIPIHYHFSHQQRFQEPS
jgi:hypothetical protein